MSAGEVYGKCRACDAIRWAVTRKGHRIPMDPEMAIDGNIELKPGATAVASPLAVYVNPNSPPQEPRYNTHFATCPAARRFSKSETARALKRTEVRVRRGL